jgi:hypothetical protein
MRIVPLIDRYVALISTSPADANVTRPLDDTVATLALLVSQVACDVTSCEVPSDNVARAVSWTVCPIVVEDEPVTATEVTDGADDVVVVVVVVGCEGDLLLQAMTATAMAAARESAAHRACRVMTDLSFMGAKIRRG